MRIAIITGASSGMGREFALQISQKETFDEIWVIARREEALKDLQQNIKTKVRPITLDLTKAESFKVYEELLQKEQPDVALLANIAGFGKFGRYDQIPLQDCMNMIDLNCKAVVCMSEICLPFMSEGAKIIQVASIAAFQPLPFINVYGATKAFVLNYAIGLDKELKDRNIRVFALCPGWTKTNFFDVAQTNPNDVKTFGVWFTAKQIVDYAMKKVQKSKKVILVPNIINKAQCTLTKIVSRNMAANIWLKIQGK